MDLRNERELQWLSSIVADIDDVAPDLRFLVVGAVARDLILRHGCGVSTGRATIDVDLGLAVAGWDRFQSVLGALVDSGRFHATDRCLHRLVHRSGIPLDLIPFGGVADESGRIVWPDNEATMGVHGFREADASALRVVLPGGWSVRVVALHMQIILKLLAWSERYTRAPRKDAADLFMLLANYLEDEGNRERLYSVGAHFLAREDFDFVLTGAWLAGHDAGCCLEGQGQGGRDTRRRVEVILEEESDFDGPLRLASEAGGRAAEYIRMLKAFQEGLTDAFRT